MELMKRLTRLWLGQSTPPVPSRAAVGQFAAEMRVTFREPTLVCGTKLSPGRYVFRTSDPCREVKHVEIFNEDRSELVANVVPALDA